MTGGINIQQHPAILYKLYQLFWGIVWDFLDGKTLDILGSDWVGGTQKWIQEIWIEALRMVMGYHRNIVG